MLLADPGYRLGMREEAKPTPTDEEIAAAETTAPDHHHTGPSEHGSLARHLREDHGLDATENLSDATLEGLHDRVHHERHASEH